LSTTYGINDPGMIVGNADTPEGHSHPFLWYDGVMTDIGMPGDNIYYAQAINSSGQIIGAVFTDEGITVAIIWQNGTICDLNSYITSGSGWFLQSALSINDSGQIVGYGIYNGQQRAFLLTPEPVPEPSMLFLTSFALLFVTGYLRRD
jgi:probable HAF family extracellular repeat protein